MDDALRKALAVGIEKVEARRAMFDDHAVAKAWLALAEAAPEQSTTTGKGLDIVVRRAPTGRNRVEYEVFVPGVEDRVGWFYCQAPMSGRVQVTNANVYEVDGIDWRRRGIGTAVYDMIERDVLAAQGQGLEPHWGSMSDGAIALWEARRPEFKGTLAGLNRLGVMATGLFD